MPQFTGLNKIVRVSLKNAPVFIYFCAYLLHMKLNKSLIVSFGILVLVAALYRIIPNRPAGFAPQMAMALFGGAMIKDKKWAILLPLASLFISDVLYQILYMAGATDRLGFYAYQLPVYLCFVVVSAFGFLLKKISVLRVGLFSIAGSTIFFLLSNLFVWLSGWGFARPKTFEGLMLCYNDALLFYRDGGLIRGFEGNLILGDMIFTAIIFGGYYLLNKYVLRPKQLVVAES
jgi:hypothetical protein